MLTKLLIYCRLVSQIPIIVLVHSAGFAVTMLNVRNRQLNQ